jgi:hypothetical protein
MLTKHLNGTQVGSGTQIDFTAPGMTAIDDGSKTTYSLAPLINVATVTVTNAQLKALRAAPKTLVAAPGAGKVLEFISATIKNNGGANAITETADNMAVKFTDGSGAQVSQDIEATGFIDQTAATITNAIRKVDSIVAYASAANKALVLHNTGDGEYGGNAAADVTLTIDIAYRVHTI